MSLRIDDDVMSLEVDGEAVATARFAPHAAAGDQGAWIVSDRPGRLFTRNQAITALTVTELLETGYSTATTQPSVSIHQPRATLRRARSRSSPG